jgi:vacuolar-type H+-ATPase subunit E/Vma4
MESIEQDKAALISGIETDARAEEEKIVKEAEKQAAEKRDYAEKKIESLLSDAQKEAEKQSEVAKRKILSGVELELKRRSMHARDAAIQEIMGRVTQRLDSMIGQPHYRSVLINWIAEAFVGLDTESAEINTSEKERALIDEQLLAEATGKINAQIGKQITLTFSNAMPLKSQGVVLTAANGHTAFNNQVRTRILRSQRQIQTLIYNTLFSNESKE